MNLKNRGAGLPDGGLFTADQLKASDQLSLVSSVPSRGALEVKSPSESIASVIQSEQIGRYVSRYGQLLVTNLREFYLLVSEGAGFVIADSFVLAENEAAFWKLVASNKVEHSKLVRLNEFLLRVLLNGAELSAPKDIAFFLASFAREGKEHIRKGSLPALLAVRRALEAALGLAFSGEQGENFFRSTLVQTLFYGVFSAWLLWAETKPDRKARFDWRGAAWYLHVPMIRTLFHEVASPAALEPLGLVEVLDRVGSTLNRVNSREFLSRFDRAYAVQYFYEPFLAAFDPMLRKELGVWFTPSEIVDYMVARVDAVLRTEMGLTDGLANKNVYVLDPCAGTGSFLVSVLRRILATLQEKHGDELVGADLKAAALERVYGFELLPAPYVVAHLQLGLFLKSVDAPLDDDKNERVNVFLTNALTGWDENSDSPRLPYPELEQERDAANSIKREKPILVIIGNPPYNGFSGVSPAEEGDLLAPYKDGLKKWGIVKHSLDDPYVRFFRIAQRRIGESAPFRGGIVCYISNYSWIHHKSHVLLRESLLRSFDKFWIDNLHGNRHVSEYGPDGKTSETIFAMAEFSPGIKQGVVTSLWLKTGSTISGDPQVFYRDDIDASKANDRRRALLASLDDPELSSRYTTVVPERDRFYSFKPAEISAEYRTWPSIPELVRTRASLGLLEKRRLSLLGFEAVDVSTRMQAYFDLSTSVDRLKELGGAGLMQDAARFNAINARNKLVHAEKFSQERIVRYAYRPFDVRWCYYTSVRPIWNEPRPELVANLFSGNRFLVYRKNAIEAGDGAPLFVTSSLGDEHLLHKDAYFAPFWLVEGESDSCFAGNLFDSIRVPNLNDAAIAYLGKLGLLKSQIQTTHGDVLWKHFLAITYSKQYLLENADGIAEDPPRCPLPGSLSVLLESSKLGEELMSLLDLDMPLPILASENMRSFEKSLAVITSMPMNGHQPESERLSITAGWGRFSSSGISIGRGHAAGREFSKDELSAIGSYADAMTDSEELRELLGQQTFDVYLNDWSVWRNVPSEVWEFQIGGYQVLKKWLSYRESSIIGRALSVVEAREFTSIVRRIARILALQPKLNRSYELSRHNAIILQGEQA